MLDSITPFFCDGAQQGPRSGHYLPVHAVTVYVISQKVLSKQMSVEKLGVFSRWMIVTNLAA